MQRPWRRGVKDADEGAATKTEGGEAEECRSWRRSSSYGFLSCCFTLISFFLSRGVLYLVFSGVGRFRWVCFPFPRSCPRTPSQRLPLTRFPGLLAGRTHSSAVRDCAGDPGEKVRWKKLCLDEGIRLGIGIAFAGLGFRVCIWCS